MNNNEIKLDTNILYKYCGLPFKPNDLLINIIEKVINYNIENLAYISNLKELVTHSHENYSDFTFSYFERTDELETELITDNVSNNDTYFYYETGITND